MKLINGFVQIVIFIFISSLLACANSENENVMNNSNGSDESQVNAIVGGQAANSNPLDNEYESVVKVSTYISNTNNSDSEEPQLCTGTVIGKNLILTAAHCLVSNLDDKKIISYQKPFIIESRPKIGNERTSIIVEFANARGHSIKVKKFKYHPSFFIRSRVTDNLKESDSYYDLAILQLSENIPSGVKVAQLFVDNSGEDKSIKVRSYGYGLNANLITESYGPKDAGKLFYVDLKGSVKNKKSQIMYDQRNGKGMCQGDSGGPDFVKKDGITYVVGVHSILTSLPIKVLQYNQNQPPDIVPRFSDMCKQGSSSVYVPAHKDWILKTALAMTKK